MGMDWGYQVRIAKELEVSAATICRETTQQVMRLLTIPFTVRKAA
jgi:hypothetical protein